MFILVYLHATRDFAFDFNLLRFKPPMLCDAQDACQAALRAGECSQGCVGSTRDASRIHVAEEKRRRLGLKNITLRITDAMLEHRDDYTHVYSTAIAGPELYAKLRSIAGSGKLCVLRSMWIGDQGADWHMESVCLGGSGEPRQLLACNLHSNASSHSGAE